jgi:peptidoglycan pentaglycine glycine transferase (the first glycine)
MDKITWNEAVASFPEPQFLQSWEWGEIKQETIGWEISHHLFHNDSREIIGLAMMQQRDFTLLGKRFRILYLPKGPLIRYPDNEEYRNQIIDGITEVAKSKKAFLLKIEPELLLYKGEDPIEEGLTTAGVDWLSVLANKGWKYSSEQIQFKNTVKIDLARDEDDILMGMKQKTRYNIRLAGKKGVSVRVGSPEDFSMLMAMYKETATRDKFTLRGDDYYLAVWNKFFTAKMLSPLIAEVEGDAVAGLMLFHLGNTAWYFHGMSTSNHRNKMPTYLLQWEAIKRAKALGCDVYDLWGAPEKFDESDSMWGVYRFKKGLGGEVYCTIGAWDLPLHKFVYYVYQYLYPLVLGTMRFLAKGLRRKN